MVVCSIIPGKDLFGGEILFNCWINSKAIHDGQTCSDPFGMIFGWGESLHNLPPISFPSEKKTACHNSEQLLYCRDQHLFPFAPLQFGLSAVTNPYQRP
jgi:hypothetical protein